MVFSVEQHLPKERLAAFCHRRHIRKLSLFGSALHGELRPDSDIDLLAEFEAGHVPGLFDMTRMEIELTDLLGRQVDLRTPEELSQHFRGEVMQEAEAQYEAAK